MQFMEAGITLGNNGGMSRATNTLRFEDIFTTKSEHYGQFFFPSILAKSCTAYTHISLHNNIPSVAACVCTRKQATCQVAGKATHTLGTAALVQIENKKKDPIKK